MRGQQLSAGAMARLLFSTTKNLRYSWQMISPLVRESGTLTASTHPPCCLKNVYGLRQVLDVVYDSVSTVDTTLYLAGIHVVLRHCIVSAAGGSAGGESGKYAGISQKSHVRRALIASLPLWWPPIWFFPRQAWETGPGSLQSCIVLYPLFARVVYAHQYLQSKLKVMNMERHFEHWRCGLVGYDTVWSGRDANVSGKTCLHVRGRGKNLTLTCQWWHRGEVDI